MDQTINWYGKDPDDVLDYIYNETEENQRFEVLKYFIENFPDLDIDWVYIFEDIKHNLLVNERIDDILFFVNWFSTKFPNDYKDEYEFLERDLCDYYLFIKDYDKLQVRIDLIQQNPFSAEDTLIVRLLFQLIYHGQYQKAIDFAEKVWKPIVKSKVLDNNAYEFVNTLYVNKLQQFYESLQNNSTFDVNKMFRSAVKMGFSDDNELFDDVIKAVKGSFDYAIVKDSIEKGKDAHMLYLNIQFLKFMYHQYNLPFVFSEWMWNFIASLEIFGKHKGIENWFYIDAVTLEKHIVNQFDTIFRYNELQVFGKVWGFNYIIEFFKHYQLITQLQFEIMSENIAHFKRQFMIIAGGDLWQMMFVLNWPDPQNYYFDNSDQLIFKSTFGLEKSEAKEKVRSYISGFPVSNRITMELKLTKPKTNQKFVGSGNSTFVKTEPSTGRNDPCPCGSGKKYKKCCLNN